METFQTHLDLDGAIATLKMHGDLTHTAEQRLVNTYDKCATSKTKYVILDFSHVEYINSAGMSIIISLLTRAQELDQEMRACGLSPHFQKIFNMVGLSKYISHYDDLQTALQGLGAQKS